MNAEEDWPGETPSDVASRAGSSRRWPNAGKTCPDDFLTPREMVGMLRASELDGVPVSAEVYAHLDECAVCADNWLFKQNYDPAIRDLYEKRVAMLIGTVVREESSARETMDPAERQQVVDDFAQDLSSAANSSPGNSGWAIVTNAESLSDEQVLALLADVQAMDDDKTRLSAARALAGLFQQRVDVHEHERGVNLDQVLESPEDVVELSKQVADVSVAVIHLARLPQCGYFQPSLLEKVGSQVFFHRKRFFQLLPEFGRLVQSCDQFARAAIGAT